MVDRIPSRIPPWLKLVGGLASLALTLFALLQLTGWSSPAATASRLESQERDAHGALRQAIADSAHALRSDLSALTTGQLEEHRRVDLLDSIIRVQYGELRGLQETQLAVMCLNATPRDLELARVPCDRILHRRGVSR